MRSRCRGPCFFPMAALHKMLEGGMIADVLAAVASIDPVMGGVDR